MMRLSARALARITIPLPKHPVFQLEIDISEKKNSGHIKASIQRSRLEELHGWKSLTRIRINIWILSDNIVQVMERSVPRLLPVPRGPFTMEE
jgi:hypothetical protein